MARTVKEPLIRRDELLDAAMSLFAERGYHATSVQAITERAGVAKGLFYHYFEGKEAALDALAHREGDRVFEAVHAVSRAIEGRPVSELAVLLGMLTRWKLVEGRELVGALLHAIYRDGDHELRDRLFRHYDDRLKPYIVELLEEGTALGEMDVEDPDACAEVLLGMWSGMRDRQMALLLSAGDSAGAIARVVANAEASERAAERIIGAAAGSLHIYEHGAIEEALRALRETGQREEEVAR